MSWLDDPKDFHEFLLAPLTNPNWLTARLFYAHKNEITSCLRCGADDERSCYGSQHPYIAYRNVVGIDPSEDIAYFDGYLTEYQIPLEEFYNLTTQSEERCVPNDCRSCIFYQTHKCMPLIEALDDVARDQNSGYIDDVETAVFAVDQFKITPCDNMVLNSNATFGRVEQVVAWKDTMMTAYDIDINSIVPQPRDYVAHKASSHLPVYTPNDRLDTQFGFAVSRALKELKERNVGTETEYYADEIMNPESVWCWE